MKYTYIDVVASNQPEAPTELEENGKSNQK